MKEETRRLCKTAAKAQNPVPIGIHHVLELYGCPAAVLNDALLLSEVVEKASKISKTKLLDKLVHCFPIQGVTVLALLAESHIAIHTWPDLGYAAIDLFACGQRAQPRLGCDYLIKALRAQQYSLRTMRRGQSDEGLSPASSLLSDSPLKGKNNGFLQEVAANDNPA